MHWRSPNKSIRYEQDYPMEDAMRLLGMLCSLIFLCIFCVSTSAQEASSPPPKTLRIAKPASLIRDEFTRTDTPPTTRLQLPVPEFTYGLRAGAPRGDIRQRLIGSFGFVLNRLNRDLPNDRYIDGRYQRPKFGFITEKYSIFPTFQLKLSQNWWQRSVKIGVRIVY